MFSARLGYMLMVVVLLAGCQSDEAEDMPVSGGQEDIETAGGIFTRINDKFAWYDLSELRMITVQEQGNSKVYGFSSPVLDSKQSAVLFKAGTYPSSIYSVDLDSLDVDEVLPDAEQPTLGGNSFYALRRSEGEYPISVLTAKDSFFSDVENIGSVPFYTVSTVHPVGERAVLVASTDGRKEMVSQGGLPELQGIWKVILTNERCIPLVTYNKSKNVLCMDAQSGNFFVLSNHGDRTSTGFSRGSLVAFDSSRDIAYILVDRGDAQERALVHDLFAIRLSDMAYELVIPEVKPFVSGVWLPERPQLFQKQ